MSDDETWKVWSVPNCDLLMSGEGHRDWVSGVSFHPHGTMLATSAGDNTVKIWDFLQVRGNIVENSVSQKITLYVLNGNRPNAIA